MKTSEMNVYKMPEVWGVPPSMDLRGDVIREYKLKGPRWCRQKVGVFEFANKFGFFMTIQTPQGGFSGGPWPKCSLAYQTERVALEEAVLYALRYIDETYYVRKADCKAIVDWLNALVTPEQMQLELF